MLKYNKINNPGVIIGCRPFPYLNSTAITCLPRSADPSSPSRNILMT